jgi:quercetin dioxygenase-like cupin family protein
MRAALPVALLFAACSQPAPAPAKPVGMGEGSQTSVMAAPVDAAAPSQEETLAAIQKAMNDLDEASQTCWAVAATDRYDVSGDLVMRIDAGPTKATVAVVTDNVHDAKLVGCMTQVLGAYRWAPPLYGQTIQLPFSFKRVNGQSVIDRQLVEAHGQVKLSVSVLLDQNNTGNAGASMFELAIAPGGTTSLRVAERAEVWYFLTAALVRTGGTFKTSSTPEGIQTSMAGQPGTLNVGAGTVMYLPKGAVREVLSKDAAVRAVIVVAPGGREGTARAGALPTPAFQATEKAPVGPKFLKGAQHGPAEIFLDASIVKDTPMAASILALGAGAKVAEHVHANETEMLYILEGSGTMTIAGQDLAITPTSVIQIPPNTKHAFAASTAVRALQFYTPPGPEQRFKKKP